MSGLDLRPSFTASAPGRCGIIGNPSDIYGGVVVACSVPARARCIFRVGPDPKPSEKLQDTRLWNAALARIPIEGPFGVEWSTSIPRSSGLAGSTALLTAMMGCLAAAAGREEQLKDSISFAELVRDAERHDAEIMCGYQDAYMTVLGGLRRLDFQGKSPVLDKGPAVWQDARGPRGKAEEIEAPVPFLLITTGVERLSGSVHGPMAERWMRGETEVVRAMDRVTELGRLGASALSSQNWTAFADLMSENHSLVASLGGSGEAIDLLVRHCLKHGALAAKLAGAGLGGTVIALAENIDELQKRLEGEGYTKFLRPERVPGLCIERHDKNLQAKI